MRGLYTAEFATLSAEIMFPATGAVFQYHPLAFTG
jgi:hypothetical protein